MRNVAVDDEVESLVARVADEFRERQKQGERPTAEEYATRHPEAADVLRRVLGALEVVGLAAAVGAEAPAAAESHLAGTLGDYRIFREVGRGGMGIVYEAEQISLDRRVALKVLPYAATMDAKQLQRFKNEAKAAAGLHHEHIVPVFAVGCERGVHYYAMQFVDGQTLAQLIAGMTAAARKDLAPAPDRTAAFVPTPSGADLRAADAGTQTPDAPRATPSTADTAPVAALSTERSGPKGRAFYRSAAELMAQAADALEHAHQLGIVHRDVKPGNLMLDAAGKLWVTDFGLARFGPDAGLTLSGDLLGTLRYMAPEQALSHHGLVDHRADVYALGATLYELLTGRPVVDAAERAEILRQIAFEEPIRPRKLDKSIPIELETITMKCLTKNPAERYATAGALSDDLRRFLADQPIRARRAGPVERARRWGRRHPALAAVYGLLMLVVALGTAGGAAAWQVADEARSRAVAALQGEKKARTGEAEARTLNDKLQAALENLRMTTYTAHMNLANHALDAGGVERVRELLEQHRPKPGESDLRGFEWFYLHRQCHPLFLTLKGVAGSVAFSPDGKRLACDFEKNSVQVWDAQTGQGLSTLKGHTKQVSSVAFSPDGKRLASAGGEVKVWDVQTDQELLTFQGHTGNVMTVAFSPDGKHLASGGYAVEQGKRIGEAKVWDARTGKELFDLKRHTGSVLRVAFSPDGKCLASVSADKTVKIWDAQTGQELLMLHGYNCVAFSPDGKRLACASEEHSVKVWDAQTGQELLTLNGHTNWVNGVAFSPDGKLLVSSAWDNTMKVWDAQTGQELFNLKGHTNWVNGVAFSPDGKHLASGGDSVRVWDVQIIQNPLILKVGAASVASVAFSPDGKRLASGSTGPSGRGPGEVKVWDVKTGQELFALKGHTSSVTGMTFSPDGKRLASGGADRAKAGEVKVWDVQTRKELLSFPVKGIILSSATNVGGAFSPDGTRLATAGGLVRVWDAQTGQHLLTCPNHVAGMVAFSPDGTRLASIGGGDVKVWDAHTGQELLTIRVDGLSVAFSPDGTRLASASEDKTMKVWDALTGQELLSLKGHSGEVNSVAFSPDGKRLASTSKDKTVKVWDAQTGQELLSLKGHSGEVNGVAFSPDGHRLAAGSAGGTVTIWDATPLPEKR